MLIHTATERIVNMFKWDGVSDWPAPEGYTVRPYEEGDMIWEAPVEEPEGLI